MINQAFDFEYDTRSLEISERAFKEQRWDIVTRAIEMFTKQCQATMESYNAMNHITPCNIPAGGITDSFELGKKGPYHRYIDFPVEVKTEVEITNIPKKQETWRDRPSLL